MTAKLKLVGGRNPSLNYPEGQAMPSARSGGLRPEPIFVVSARWAPAAIAGHRTYLDNPRLVTVRVRKPPIPRGHRAFLTLNKRGEVK